MNECLLATGLSEDVGRVVLFFAFYLLVGLVPACAVLYVIYFMLTLPLRRKERARLFVDLLESALAQGQSPESAVTSVAAMRDLALGVRFYMVSDQIAAGRRLSEALTRVPRFVPPQVASILRVGERIGSLQAVLPVCRNLMQDGVSQVRGALNYLIVLVFALTPALVIIPSVVQTHVLPKFQAIFAEMSVGQLPAFTRLVFNEQPLFLAVEVGILLFLWLLLIAYLGGPRLAGWINSIFPGVVDWVQYALPWRRKRMQRDFSSLLALLLDARVPEAEAVQLAAEAVNNRVIIRRAGEVQRALRQGRKLPEAIIVMDEQGEFRWRLENAAYGSGGFSQALSGWHEALNAKAFQLEQTAAQTATTFMVLLNGVVVGCLVVAVFLALIAITNDAILW